MLDSERKRAARVNDRPLTAEQILDAAEEVLRRFGPEKANVVDLARALGASRGSVYRHFFREQSGAPRRRDGARALRCDGAVPQSSHAAEWADAAASEAAFERIWSLIAAGLGHDKAATQPGRKKARARV